MHTARKILLAVLLACPGILTLTATAAAAQPATVTVRVEGASETLLPPTVITTTTTPVVKDGKPADSCPGEDAIGALQVATGGNWGGKWESGFHEYVVETILGESHLFTSPTYWEVWYDHEPAKQGACKTELTNGETVLFFPDCFGAECPPHPNPLGIEAPAGAMTGTRLPVTVLSYANATGAPSPAAGATIAYDGKTTETDSTGDATLEFADPGQQLVKVSKAASVRTETTICVHAAGASACGPPSGGPAVDGTSGNGNVAGFTSSSLAYKGTFALVAHVSSVRDGGVYRRGHAPQLITGTVSSHSTVTSVSLTLRRIFHGRCSSYDAPRGRFRHARCGSASAFDVSKSAAFSYFLPNLLAPGRYVLDVRAKDIAGNALAPSRGTSRLVFYVR